MKSFKQYFLEAKQVGILYHYTDVSGVIGIVETNTLQENGNKYVSFTRDKHFHKGDRYEGITGTSCRFIIDGDLLSHHYKIEPYNDFGKRKIEYKGQVSYSHVPYYDEQEERIKGSIKNFKQYIIKLEVDENAYDTWVELYGHSDCLDDESELVWLADYKNFESFIKKYCPMEWV